MAPKEMTNDFSTSSDSIPSEISCQKTTKQAGVKGAIMWVRKRWNKNEQSTKIIPEQTKPSQPTKQPEQPPKLMKSPESKPMTEFLMKKQKSLPEKYNDRTWSLDMDLPYEQIDAEDVSFKQVDLVMRSWAKVEIIPNYLQVGGDLLMRKMFELDPAFRVQFGFQEDSDPNDPAVYESPQFIQHGIALTAAVDKAIHFLGPDLEPLELDLRDLGRRHIFMGAFPEHWPLVGIALFHVLEQALGDQFTEKVQNSWKVVYHFLAYNMIMGLIAELSERQNQ